jgi:Ca2+:H+ antiporter
VNSSLLTISVIAVLIPAAFVMAISTGPSNGQTVFSIATEGAGVLLMSRGVSMYYMYHHGQQLTTVQVSIVLLFSKHHIFAVGG